MNPLTETVANGWRMSRNPFGKLVLTRSNGERFEGVEPVRAFPVLSPGDGIAMVSTDGKEVAWIDRLSDLAPDQRVLIEEEGEVVVTDQGVPKYRLTPYSPPDRKPTPPSKDYLARLRRHQPRPMSATAAKALDEANRGDR